MEKEELKRWLKFCKVRGIGSSKVIKLLGIFGNFSHIYTASNEELYRTRIFTLEMIELFNHAKEEDFVEDFVLQICERENINIIPLYSLNYPANLKNLPDAPLTLYAKGNLDLLTTQKIAIVGSRESEHTALKWALTNARDLVKENITVVSGGAKGIDYQAHSGALNLHGKTICVLGSGLLRLYPPEHRNLFKRIIDEGGLLLSEHPPTDRGGRLSLLRRNRIISGISDAIIIVTSKKSGGSRTQIEIARKQRIPIFVPNLSLDLRPNEGIAEAISEDSITQIDSYKEVMEVLKLNKNLSN